VRKMIDLNRFFRLRKCHKTSLLSHLAVPAPVVCAAMPTQLKQHEIRNQDSY
jgi:hypothetical protein